MDRGVDMPHANETFTDALRHRVARGLFALMFVLGLGWLILTFWRAH